MPKLDPVNLPVDLPAAMQELQDLVGESETLQLARRVMQQFNADGADLTKQAEHTHLLPEGGTYDDLLTECLHKVETAIEEVREAEETSEKEHSSTTAEEQLLLTHDE